MSKTSGIVARASRITLASWLAYSRGPSFCFWIAPDVLAIQFRSNRRGFRTDRCVLAARWSPGPLAIWDVPRFAVRGDTGPKARRVGGEADLFQFRRSLRRR